MWVRADIHESVFSLSTKRCFKGNRFFNAKDYIAMGIYNTTAEIRIDTQGTIGVFCTPFLHGSYVVNFTGIVNFHSLNIFVWSSAGRWRAAFDVFRFVFCKSWSTVTKVYQLRKCFFVNEKLRSLTLLAAKINWNFHLPRVKSIRATSNSYLVPFHSICKVCLLYWKRCV